LGVAVRTSAISWRKILLKASRAGWPAPRRVPSARRARWVRRSRRADRDGAAVVPACRCAVRRGDRSGRGWGQKSPRWVRCRDAQRWGGARPARAGHRGLDIQPWRWASCRSSTSKWR